MVNMLFPSEKIKVFISSACGDAPEKQKYNIVRVGLKKLIESTGFAKVYLFEDKGASIISAENHYSFGLEDSDLCIFLIDNADGIFPGVQKEIDTVNKHNINALYYFCAENENEHTPLQKSLTGAQYAKSKTVKAFEDLLVQPANAFLDDIVQIYISHCNGRLVWQNNDGIQEASQNISENLVGASSPLPKSVLSNIDGCKNYFASFILNQNIVVEKTSNLDNWCLRFLPILFEGKEISEFNTLMFMDELAALYTDKSLFEVVKKRWEAIQFYFGRNVEKCIGALEKALEMAEERHLADWVSVDILIDLRNMTSFHGEAQNKIWTGDDIQKRIDARNTVVYYPLLDRMNSDLYENMTKKDFKETIKSPYRIIYGSDEQAYLTPLTSTFVVAMYSGSLIHMLVLNDHIRNIAYHLTSQYSDWHLKKLLFKTAVFDCKKTEIDGIIRKYKDLLCRMDEQDAKEVYEYTTTKKIPHQKFIANLEAFRTVGYFLGDNDFDCIWATIKQEIIGWLEQEDPNIYFPSHVFAALQKNEFRLDHNDLATICIKTMEKKLVRFYDDMYNLIAVLDLDKVSSENQKRLIELITEIVNGEKNESICIRKALYRLRKQNREGTALLDSAIREKMAYFYENEYALETSDNEPMDMPRFVANYIDSIENTVDKLAETGTYYGRLDANLSTVFNILRHSNFVFEHSLISRVIKVVCKVLHSKEPIDEKSSALTILVYLSLTCPDAMSENRELILALKENQDAVEDVMRGMSNLSKLNLKISLLLLYNWLGDSIWMELAPSLTEIEDDAEKINASQILALFSHHSCLTSISTELLCIILQYALLWCGESNLDIRWNAANILLDLANDDRCSEAACTALVKLMDNDNFYIKNRILRNLERIKDVDHATYDYILQKASLDTNFVVRKVYREVANSTQPFVQ